MAAADPRAALDALVAASGSSYAALSRMLGRNVAYLQQYVRRGTPRTLPERDRARLAAFFGVDEAVLGAPQRMPVPRGVRRLDLAAAAGAGTLAEDEPRAATMAIDPTLLAALKLDPARASVLTAKGDSMQPTIQDGDTILVDERARRPGKAGGVFVIRHDDALMVKRVAERDGTLVAASDNPSYAPFALDRASRVIGRVVWLSRALA